MKALGAGRAAQVHRDARIGQVFFSALKCLKLDHFFPNYDLIYMCTSVCLGKCQNEGNYP